MKKRGTKHSPRDFKNNAAGRLISTFFGIQMPKPEPVHRCEREGSQAFYRDHKHLRERARNLFRPGPQRQAFIDAEGNL